MRPDAIITVDNKEGECSSVMGGNYRIVVTGEQTGGAFAVIDMMVPPGGGPGPHAHAAIQETFYIVQGEVVVRSETQTYTARQGDYICIPKGGAIHNFKNESGKMAQLLCTVTPAGMEAMFREIGQPVASGEFLPAQPPTPDQLLKLKEIGDKYGQEFFAADYFDK